MFKKVLASATLVAVMTSMLGMTAFAADATIPWDTNGGSQEITGDGVPVEPIIQVELPGDLSFGINPLRLDGDEDGKVDAQIVSSDYTISNYSNVDVLITAKTWVTVKDTVDLKKTVTAADDYDKISNELNPTTDKKAMWLVQLLPNEPTEFDATEGTPILKVKDLSYDGTDESTSIAGKTLGSDDKAPTEVLFKLKQFDYTKAEAEQKLAPTNVSGFKFAGVLDPNATFEAEDVKVTTIFTLNTLSTKQYEESYGESSINSVKLDVTVTEKKTNP